MDTPRRLPAGWSSSRREASGLNTPWLWIVGGPNGSGKSTLIRHGALDSWTGGLRALSPDDIVLELRAKHPAWTEVDLLRTAQARSDGLVDAAIAAGETLMVETVLSSAKFEGPVEAAIAAGFLFGFVYVTVRSAELNEARVGNRVARGGHDVPPDRIRARRERSHAAFTWFAERAHVGMVFDNSDSEPALLAEKRRSEATWRVLDRTTLAELAIHIPA